MELDRVGQDRRAGKRGAVISPLPPVIPAWGDSFLLPPQSTPTFLIPPLLWVLWMALEGERCSLSHLEDRVVSGGQMTVCLCDEGSNGNLNSQCAG